MSPVDKLGSQACINDLKLDDHPAKVLVQIGFSQSAKQFLQSRNCTTSSVKITERDVHEPAVLIEATLQNDGVVMGIESQVFA